ncbi:MAG TPA: hypothetical protein VD905_22055, partial [Flavobacteriales bacterium]|nr:hypothetical protein [Flavobacteriales bacterium]
MKYVVFTNTAKERIYTVSKKAIYIVCLMALGQLTVIAQTRKELIELGDQAFKKGNYGSAVYFYKKLFFGSAGKNDVTFPYEVVSYG